MASWIEYTPPTDNILRLLDGQDCCATTTKCVGRQQRNVFDANFEIALNWLPNGKTHDLWIICNWKLLLFEEQKQKLKMINSWNFCFPTENMREGMKWAKLYLFDENLKSFQTEHERKRVRRKNFGYAQRWWPRRRPTICIQINIETFSLSSLCSLVVSFD